MRVLEIEANAEDLAVKAAQESFALERFQYIFEVGGYLNVIVAQTALLQGQVQAVNTLNRSITASILLIEYPGGG